MAGDGTQGFSGDGGLATRAETDWPGGVVADGAGFLIAYGGESRGGNGWIQEVSG